MKGIANRQKPIVKAREDRQKLRLTIKNVKKQVTKEYVRSKSK